MNDNLRAMMLGSLAADALALGVHWVYNANVIDRKYGRILRLSHDHYSVRIDDNPVRSGERNG